MAQTNAKQTTDLPNEGGGVEAITELAQAAVKGEILQISTEGLGEGLPKTVPLFLKPGERPSLEAVKSLLEVYRTGPERRTGTAKVTTLKAFIELVKRHKDEGSVIFARTDWPNPSLTAVIDYHSEANAPRHLGHRVHYAFPITEEFAAWIKHNGVKFDQAEFAQFLEDHAAELIPPEDGERGHYERLFKAKFANPNELIDLSRSLEIAVGQRLKNAVKLQSGEGEITFVEEHTNTQGEAITVPGVFMIQLRAFVDGEPVQIAARLRYRVAGGAIVWFYHLYRWEDQLRDRVGQDLDKAGKDTALPTFEGSPEA